MKQIIKRLVSLLLNKLHQSGSQDISKLFSVVDDQEEIKREITHIRLNLHLSIHILHRLNVQNRILLRIYHDKHISNPLFHRLLQERLHHVLVHLPVRYDDTQLTALSIGICGLDLFELV